MRHDFICIQKVSGKDKLSLPEDEWFLVYPDEMNWLSQLVVKGVGQR